MSGSSSAVERQLPKLDATGSIPVSRSKFLRFLLILALATQGVSQLKYDRAIDWNLPETATKKLEANHIFEKYTLSDRVNPFYLRGDFDGDQKPDYAILMTNITSKKIVMVFCFSSRKNPTLVPRRDDEDKAHNRKPDDDGAEDFSWMDAWQVLGRKQLTPNELKDSLPVGRMVGEGVEAIKTESASVLIYWDGSKFRYFQTSD